MTKLRSSSPCMQYAEDEGALKKALTFSSPPNIPRAKPAVRSDYSHSKHELEEIVRENSSLIDRLSRINSRQKPQRNKSRASVYTKPLTVSHASINRKKQLSRIAEDNLRLYKRLQVVKPCKEIQRSQLEKDYAKNMKYLENCSQFKLRRTTTE